MVSPHQTTAPPATIRVTHLPSETSEAEIGQLFSPYGEVHQIKMVLDEQASSGQRIAYVDMVCETGARAIAHLDGHLFNGSIIHLNEVLSSPPMIEDAIGDQSKTLADNETPSNLLRRRYAVESVEKAVIPIGGQGSNWHRYVLASGSSRIVGYHQGTVKDVTAFAESCAEEFNLRNVIGPKTMSGGPRKPGSSPAAQPKARPALKSYGQ
jgi:RNA recognition motif-containing protein